jgi:urease accessory protein
MTATAIPLPHSLEPEPPERGRVRSALHLDFARDDSSGNTFLADSLQEPPLKVVRAFSQDDGAALVHLHNVSGGLLGGDHLSLRVNLAPQTRVQLTTTGATRIYRHRPDYPLTVQQNEITVGEGAMLEFLPDAIIPFAGARFLQRTSISLAAGTGLFWWEIVAPGREASGELFQYDQFEMRTVISVGGRRISAENILLRPASQNLFTPAGFGEYRYAATFYICLVGIDANSWRAAEIHLRELTAILTRPGEALWGVGTLLAHGLAVRCLSRSGRGVLPGLYAVWRRAKLHLHGREANPPRKVN